MESADQILSPVEVITSCVRTTFDGDAYMAMIEQNYLPPVSFEYIKGHWIPQDCIRKSAAWFKEVAERLEVSVGDLGEVYVARAGFVLAFLVTKHALEYETALLPGNVRSKIESAAVESLELDAVVGHIWPIIIGADVGALYALKPLRERLERGGLRLVKRVVAPLAVFGVVTDILHKSGLVGNYFTATGFGRMVDRLTETALDHRHVDLLLRDVSDLLVSVSRVHEEMFQYLSDALREFRGVAKMLVNKYVKRGNFYAAEDAALDAAHFILAAADHYERGGAEVRALLRRLRWGGRLANSQEVKELVVRRLFAKLVRAW